MVGVFIFLFAGLGTLWAGPAITRSYYLPITEDEAHLHYASLNLTPGYDDYIVNVISISPAVSNTVVYYDQWEDGFEVDLANPVQATTQIWGDNNPANGIPPGFASDLVNAGQALVVISTNAQPHVTGTFYYDGGDKLGASKPISVSMVLWPVFHDETGDGVDLAEGISVLDTTRFGTEFYAPLGTDLSPANMFESVRFNIMASKDGTVVSVDRDGNGTVDVTRTLAEGEGWSDGPIVAGGKVTATQPVQVHIMTGDIDAKYANRWATLYPTSLWSADHYSPVGLVNAAYPVYVYLFNKETNALAVSYLTSSSYGTVTVPAKGVYRHTVATDTGTRFYAANGTTFQAVMTHDTDTGFDWSATLIPGSLLSTVTSVSFGPGAEYGTVNGSPIWVTATRATTIYADFDGNPATGALTDPQGGKYDAAFSVVALQSTRVRDTVDNDQTGMRLYTLDGIQIVSMWGEEPDPARGGRPFIDAGTSIIPISGVTVGDFVWDDRDADGVQDSSEPGLSGVQVQVYTSGGAPFQPRRQLGVFADSFDQTTTAHLDGSVGTLAWTGPWTVTANASVPLISGSDYEVRIADDLNSALTRGFVVPAGTDRLTISYDFRPSGAGDDTVKAQVLTNGTTWVDLATYVTGPGTTSGTATNTVVVTPGTNYIRFAKTALGAGVSTVEYMYFDNVSILAETASVNLISTTDSNGYYAFDSASGLIPGTAYQLRVDTNQTSLAGFGLTGQDLGGNDAADSDASLTNTAGFATIPFTAPSLLGSNQTLDFGFLQAGLGDFVWNDANFNGQQDAGEAGLNGVTVNLYRPGYGPDGIAGNGDDTNAVATTVTAGGGAYRFTNLPSGGYAVEFAPLANFARTTANSGADGTDSDADATTGRTATVTLTAGQSNTTLDAGYYVPPPALGDFVWFDENANGQQDGGEPGLNGVTVQLFRPGVGPDGVPGNGDDVAVVATTVTSGAGAGAGFYSFTGISTGAYQLVFGPLAGYHRSPANQGADATDSDADSATGRTATVTVLAGQYVNTVDAGYNNLGVGDFIWKDLDADGVQDTNEPGLTGVVVRAYTSGGTPYQIRTTLGNFADNFDPSGGVNGNDGTLAWAANWTAAAGAAVVVNTAPDYEIQLATTANSAMTRTLFAPTNTGLLTISFDYREGTGTDTVRAQFSTNGTTWVDLATYTTGSAGSGNDSFTVATTVGTRYFRFYKTAGTSGTMYFDKVNIVAETALTDLTSTTDAAGYYSFGAEAGLMAGTNYQLRVATSQPALAGLALTGQNRGGNDATDSDASLTNAAGFATIAFAAPAGGGSDQTLDFGFGDAASLGDKVWNDLNANGVQDGGEAGLDGVTVTVYNAADNSVAGITSTAGGGLYSFNLVAGTHYVVFGTVAGYARTLADQGGDTADSDANPSTGRTGNVTLTGGQTNTTLDAGYYQPASVGDFVWVDADGDGQQDSGEAGLAGVTVTLYRPGYGPDGIPGNADDASSVAATTSGSGGGYSFTNLPPATYQVGFGTATGYNRTAADQGSDTTDSDANGGTGLTAAFAVTSGQTLTTIDAGYQAVAVGDFVWTDLDADGVQDTGEPGISGVQIQVYTAAGSPYLVRTALGTFADNFDPSGGLTNSDGTLVWASDWTAANGATVVVNTGSDYEIQIADTANSTLTRSFTAPSGTARLTISFDYRSGAGNDTVQAQWSSNGTDWVMLASYSTAPGSSGTTNVTVATTAGTRYVRFTKTAQGGAGGGTEYMYFDNVSILAETAPAAVTTTTDAYGYYLFGPSAGLVSGTNYQLRVATNQTALAGLALTGQNLGGNDATDSDATLAITNGFATIAFTAPAAGGSDQTLDFGFKGTASFGDRVWTDLDGDGSQDAFESGIVGVRVYADSNGSGTYNIGEPTAVTAANGTYLITNLVAGSYTARVDTATLPAGVAQTYDLNGALDHAATVALTANQTRTDVDFGYRSTVVYAIRGQVRDDYDLDGAFSDPDKPVGGVLVSLYSDPNGDGTNTDGVVLGTVRTSPDGRYAFTNVMSGAYVVVENDPTYSVSTADTVAANDNRIPVVIVSADSAGNDFLDAVDPSGYIYDVADGRIVPGGRIDVSGPGALVLMDGSSGQYMFISTNDAPSTFTISVTPPPGYIIDPKRPAQPGSFDPTGGANPTVLGSYESAVTPGYLVNYSAASNTYYYSFTLTPGDPPVINNNFPLVKTVTVGDRVWEDVDGDGAQDAGEAGVTNVTVRLLNAADGVVSTTVTDASGLYVFTNLPPASYRVEFAPVSEYRLTVRDSAAATDATDSDADAATGRTGLTAVAAGATNLTLDAGLYVPARVFGHLFVDKDGDLIRDTGDSSITNALVRLIVGGVTVASTNTDAIGYYFFGDVPAGTVSILVSRASATLIDVPTTDPALSDVRRNRAEEVPNDEAFIAHPVTSGYGVLASRPGQPLNFGFASYPLSTALDVSLYATGDGGVMIELWTVNESGQADIVIYAWINNAWAEVGRVPGDQVRGDGSNRYAVRASGLAPGVAYNLMIVDEAGHVHYSNGPLEVRAIRMDAVRLSLETVLVAFNTEVGRRYTVMVSTDLVTWAPEFVSYPTSAGWSAFTDEPFTARGPRTEVYAPVNGRAKAFYKTVMKQE